MSLTHHPEADADPRAFLDSIESRYSGLIRSHYSRGDQLDTEKDSLGSDRPSPQQESVEISIVMRANAKIEKLKAEKQAAKEGYEAALERIEAKHGLRYRQMEEMARNRQFKLICVENQCRELAAKLELTQEKLNIVLCRAAYAEAEVARLREYIRLGSFGTIFPQSLSAVSGGAGSSSGFAAAPAAGLQPMSHDLSGHRPPHLDPTSASRSDGFLSSSPIWPVVFPAQPLVASPVSELAGPPPRSNLLAPLHTDFSSGSLISALEASYAPPTAPAPGHSPSGGAPLGTGWCPAEVLWRSFDQLRGSGPRRTSS
jgi:hypothetical protein